MHRICSASGTTTSPNEDITGVIKALTLLKDQDDSNFPFVLRKINIFLNADSDIYFNTEDDDITLGLNKTFVKESFPGSGEYIVATNLSEVFIKRIVIVTSGTSWEMTFLY